MALQPARDVPWSELRVTFSKFYLHTKTGSYSHLNRRWSPLVETPERARAMPPPPIRAAKPPPPPTRTLRPSSPLLPPPCQPSLRPQRSLEPPHEACTESTRRGHKRGTNGQRASQKRRNGGLRVARAWVMVVGAAASGISAWRRAAAAADRVREVAEGRVRGQHT